MKKILITACLLGISSIAWGEVSEQRELSLDAAGLSSLRADVGAGSLEIEGIAGATEVHVVATIVIDTDSAEKAKKSLSSEIKLTLERDGDRAVLIAKSNRLRFFGSSPDVMINLEVTVPESFDLDIDDGSGDVEVRNIGGKIKLDDGSGSIDMESIGGDVTVDDGSGSIRIHDIGGALAVDDGSGSINISKVNGTVDVDDGSGDLDIREVNDTVYITDGSGGITVTDLQGDLVIRESGSGSMVINGVKGSVETDE